MSCVVPGCGRPPRYCDDCRDRAYEAMRYWDKRAHRLEAALRDVVDHIVATDIDWRDSVGISGLLTDIQIIARHALEPASAAGRPAMVCRDCGWDYIGVPKCPKCGSVYWRKTAKPASAIGCTCDGIAPHKHWCPAAGYPPPPNMFCKHPRIEWGNTGLAESSCLDCGQLNPVKPDGPKP